MDIMNKSTLKKQLSEVNAAINNASKNKNEDVKAEMDAKYEPLVRQAAEMKKEIEERFDTVYKAQLDELIKKQRIILDGLSDINIQEAGDIWYPNGATVSLWEFSGRSYERKLTKTSKEGVVTIYDGTQALANVKSYSLPKKGDIIVMHKKMDGSIGLKFDVISEYGGIKSYHPNWYIDGDTPTDNIETRAEKQTSEEDYEF